MQGECQGGEPFILEVLASRARDEARRCMARTSQLSRPQSHAAAAGNAPPPPSLKVPLGALGMLDARDLHTPTDAVVPLRW